MKKRKNIVIDQEFLNDMTADQMEDYLKSDTEEEFFRELRKNRYPKGV